MCLQKSKWMDQNAKELDNFGFKLWYIDKVRSRIG